MFGSDLDRDDRPLIGVSVSAVSLLALAWIVGFCLIVFALAYVGTVLGGVHTGIGRGAGTGFILLAFCGLCFVTFWAWKALYRERAWALWIARTWAALLLLLGGLDLYHLYRPHAPVPDEYFGIVYDPVLMICGTSWLFYLLLPKVRARFRTRQATDPSSALP
jgi:hypothetical protein